MKFKTKIIKKTSSTIIAAIMLMASFSGVLFAKNQNQNINENNSLLDVLELKKGDKKEVIVKFSSPSLLELNNKLDKSYSNEYEQKLISEQDSIFDKIGINPECRYTGVINAATITANEKQIRQLEQISGVEGVYLLQSFDTFQTDEYQKNSISISDIMGTEPSIASEYTGDGVLVAVLDSGITFNHEAFNNTKYVVNPSLTSEDVINLGYNSPAGYYNKKIPFYYDYTGSNSDFVDVDGHGSHVAGIIAGYAENNDGTVKFKGVAPGAQICAMRVLNEVGGGNDKMIISALEDAYKLGVDIINISFGRDSSFRLGGEQYISYNGIYENLEKAGVMVVCSAGNLGSMAENTPRHVLDENCVDYGTLSLPAIYPGNIGVGSIDSGLLYAEVINIEEENYRYSDRADSNNPLNFANSFNNQTFDIAYFNNYGKEEDYDGVDVTGKIVAVNRGGLSFTDKCSYASEAGAIGLIVINGENDDMGGMVINNQTIPAILVENGFAKHLPKQDYVVKLEYGMIALDGRGDLSYFSAVGVTPDLEIGLDILGIGGKITSVKSNTTNEYISYSGTSMAAPTIAGTYALLYQKLKEADINNEKSRADIANYIEDVTQSTATLITDDYGNKYSPRFQGAGFINYEKASTANAYIKTPLVSLGYDKNASGKISMEYELVNTSENDINYTATVSAITDLFTQISPTDYKNNVTPRMLNSSSYSYTLSVDGVDVTANELIKLPKKDSITVKIDLALSQEVVSIYSAAFPYGYFLDGFVEFYDVTNPYEAAIHGGYVSFVGDWLEGPAIEPLTQTDVMDWINSIGVSIDELLPYFAAGHINANYNYTSLLLDDGNHYIGENPLAGDIYIPSHLGRNAISASVSNADEIIYDSLYICPSLLRSCKSIRYVVTNSETGEVYASDLQTYVRKDIPYVNYQHIGLSDFEFDASYTAPNELGQITKQYIPTGTNVTISIYTTLDHPDATERLEAQYKITIDYSAPELYYDYNKETKLLTVRCLDSEYLAGVVIKSVDDSYNIGSIIDSRIYADNTPGVEHVEVFDLSDYENDNISITVSDYASNIVNKVLSLKDDSISNIESSIDIEDGISIDFLDVPYVYQEINFTVKPEDGWCFTDEFSISVNGTKLDPSLVENGVYSYRLIVKEEKLVFTSNGVMTHNFVPKVTKEATCTNNGQLSHICCNCSQVGKVEEITATGHIKAEATTVVEATCNKDGIATTSCSKCGILLETKTIKAHGHKEGQYEILKEATCVETGLSVIKCLECGSILKVETIPAKGHDHTSGDKASVFSPAVCGTCGESYGIANSKGVIVLSIVLSSISILSMIFVSIMLIIKKKRPN